MGFLTIPKDGNQVPLPVVYVHGVGWVVMGGSTNTDNDSGNISTAININLTQLLSAAISASNALPVNVQHGNVVDAGNSSTALLTSGNVFTGVAKSALNYSAIALEVFADQNSASGGLQVLQSQDGTHFDLTDSFTVSANTPFTQVVNLVGQYYQVKYTNGPSGQGTFRLQTIDQAVESVLPRTLSLLGNLRGSIQEWAGAVPGVGNSVPAAALPLYAALQGKLFAYTPGATFAGVSQTSSGYPFSVFNPSGSTKSLLIVSITALGNGAGTSYHLNRTTADPVYGTPGNISSQEGGASPPASVASVTYTTTASAWPAVYEQYQQFGQNTLAELVGPGGIYLPPGSGVTVWVIPSGSVTEFVRVLGIEF